MNVLKILGAEGRVRSNEIMTVLRRRDAAEGWEGELGGRNQADFNPEQD